MALKDKLSELAGKWVRIQLRGKTRASFVKIIVVVEDCVVGQIATALTPRAAVCSEKKNRVDPKEVKCEIIISLRDVVQVICWDEDQVDEESSSAPVLKMTP